MKYYTSKDIQEITGCGQAKCYAIIAELNKKLQKEYPGTIVLEAKVPIWYFNKKLLCEGEPNNEKEIKQD